MDFYYCTSKWEHAVICTTSTARAKRVFLDILNAQLEEDRQLGTKDVSAFLVNVYLDRGASEKDESFSIESEVCDCGEPFPVSGYCRFCGAHALWLYGTLGGTDL